MKTFDSALYDIAQKIYSDNGVIEVRDFLTHFTNINRHDDHQMQHVTRLMQEWRYSQLKTLAIMELTSHELSEQGHLQLFMGDSGINKMLQMDSIGLMRMLVPVLAVNNSIQWTTPDESTTALSSNLLNCTDDTSIIEFNNCGANVCEPKYIRLLSSQNIKVNGENPLLRDRSYFYFLYKEITDSLSNDLSMLAPQHRLAASKENIKIYGTALSILFDSLNSMHVCNVELSPPVLISQLNEYFSEDALSYNHDRVISSLKDNIILRTIVSHMYDMDPIVFGPTAKYKFSKRIYNQLYIPLRERQISQIVKCYEHKRRSRN